MGGGNCPPCPPLCTAMQEGFLFTGLCCICLTFVAVSTSCGVKPAQQTSRIIGGVPSNPGDWPWHAMLFKVHNSTNKKPVCGATLIMPNWVITAAHCVADIIDKSSYEIRVGTYKRTTLQGPEQEIGIKNIYVHPEFNTLTKYNYDAALIRLEVPAMISPERRTGLACLPSVLSNPLPNSLCWVTGKPCDFYMKYLMHYIQGSRCADLHESYVVI